MTRRPPVWVHRLAAHFWEGVGALPPFPRDLRPSAEWFQELHTQPVPHLSAALAAEHFARFGIPFAVPTEDRLLRGCFGARGGVALILFDPTDPPDEQRFTFAHELAHFLRDYLEVRASAVKRCGKAVLEVLDGLRPATFEERLAGALRGVPVGPLGHFMERDRWGRVVSEAARESEEAADRLAFELLAPFDAVNPGACHSPAVLEERLRVAFGLPPAPAAQYARILLG